MKNYSGVEQSVARRFHKPKVAGSSPAPATKLKEVKMIILANSTLTDDYSSKWVNGNKEFFDNLDEFQDRNPINNWALQVQWQNVVGTADATIKVYSTLENVKTLEHTAVINTASNVNDALTIDMSGIIVAGFNVEVTLNSVTSIDLSIDAIIS